MQEEWLPDKFSATTTEPKKENEMVEKLRIAVVVKSGYSHPKHQVGSIVFRDAESDDIYFYEDVYLKGRTLAHSDNVILTTVIDTREAKGNAALGAFLMMVKHYRLARTTGLDWPVRECRADDAYRALERLYENGDVDDTITIKINDADCKISRVSAETMIEALRAELKWDQR